MRTFVLSLLVLYAALCAGTVQAANTIESLVMPGKVIQGHARIESNCRKCHEPFDKSAQNTLCVACHTEVGQDIARKQGLHGRVPAKPCRECHTDHKGANAGIVVLKEAGFDHRHTDYLLKGKHADARIRCAACHIAGKKHRDAPHACEACHGKQDPHQGALGPTCANCHVEKSWLEVEFDHEETRFPLLGKHVKTQCKDCHRDQQFKDTPRDCVACHRKDDKHKGSLGPKCGQCHGERTWDAGLFDHDKDTGFALKGKHSAVKCESCHKGLVFKEKIQTACVACHRKDDAHKGRYGERCDSCHGEKSWKEIRFDHARDTRFALQGKHTKVRCDDCHRGSLYQDKVSGACLSCHRKDDTHKGRYGERCDSCHTDADWKPTRFNHDRDTRFVLKGKHAPVKCDACHRGHLFNDKIDNTCATCHAKDDKHAKQLGPKCENCHTEKSWKVEHFDHSKSRFPLVGQHAQTGCQECHATARFKDASMECKSCHVKDDVHKGALGTKCEACHNARDWRLWDFNHNKQTAFILDGAHKRKSVTCAACHTNAQPRAPKIDTTCASCHAREDVHDGTFGARCERCHATTNWKQLTRSLVR